MNSNFANPKPEKVNRQDQGGIFPLAAIFGLITGLIEGVIHFVVYRLGWMKWPLGGWPVDKEIVWVSPLIDFIIFIFLALLFLLLRRLTSGRLPLAWLVFVLAWLTVFDWLSLMLKMSIAPALILAAGVASIVMRAFAARQVQLQRRTRFALPLVAAIAVLAFIGIQGGDWMRERAALSRLPAPRPASPNIIVVILDAVRADHLSAYGYPRPTTPNLSRFAAHGVLFENAFSPSSWTLPSHASMLTGRYPHEHGAQVPRYVLDDRLPTIGEAFYRRGYHTAGFSGNTFFFNRPSGLARGFSHFNGLFFSPFDMAIRTFYGLEFDFHVWPRLGGRQVPGRKLASEVNRETLQWIDARPNQPFIAFLNYFDAHDPYLPPEPYRSQFSEAGSKPGSSGGLINYFQDPDPIKLNPRQIASERDAYDGALRYLDDQFQALLQGLEERGLAANTIIVVTADHGESIGEHAFSHGKNLYQEVIRVPLIFYWKGHIPEGERVVTPVGNISLPATLLQLTGEMQPEFPGPSLSLLWARSSASIEWPYPISELEQHSFSTWKRFPIYNGAMESVITADWHYIRTENVGEELYNWKIDPLETHNLFQSPEGAPQAARLAAYLKLHIAK